MLLVWIEFWKYFLESDHDHDHDDDITSVSFVSDTPLDFEKIPSWFGKLFKQKDKF